MTITYDIVAPNAGSLMESLRASGYLLPDAMADLIDNSITALARNVWLDFHWSGGNSCVAITDDGMGMSEGVLTDAMRIGSRNPTEEREASDLGRYGLGLKTASLSQARCLTVASRTEGQCGVNIRRWDLDHLASTSDWQLLRVQEKDLVGDAERFNQHKHGTMVVWEKLDRLVGNVSSDNTRARQQFHSVIRSVEDHVAMVFHRFMSRRNPLSIWINGQRVRPWDPFLQSEDATQTLSTEHLGSSDAQIAVTPYVLPHHSRLTEEKHRAAGGPGGWNAQQGFYVYRNHRLILPGDWLGLGFQKEEHYKLARIRVDIPNFYDHEWGIDIRKSRARPPLALRDDLLRIARATRKRAVGVYRHRGKTISRGLRSSPTFVWQRSVRRQRVSYVINRDHPLIKSVLDGEAVYPKDLRWILRLIEEYVPVQQIWVDAAEGDESQSQPFESAANQEVIGMIQALYHALTESGLSHSEALNKLAAIEAIGERFELIERALCELTGDERDG